MTVAESGARDRGMSPKPATPGANVAAVPVMVMRGTSRGCARAVGLASASAMADVRAAEGIV
jgi:hypothetical protein